MDNPHYNGFFADTNSTVNVSFDSCAAVGVFLHDTLPALSRNLSLEVWAQQRAERARREQMIRDSNGTLAANSSNASMYNGTLEERFLAWSRSHSCDCGACPVTCGSCDRCYREGELFGY